MGDNTLEIVADTILEDNQQLQSKTQRQCLLRTLDLLQNDLTVPYIARYRKKETGGMEAEEIRQIQQSYENYKKVQIKVDTILKKIGPDASKELIQNIKEAKTVDEVQELYAPFKKGGKGTLAERARKVGLDDVAQQLLQHSNKKINFKSYIQLQSDGLKTEEEVIAGIQHVVSDIVYKDSRVKEKVKETLKDFSILMITKATGKVKEVDSGSKFHLYYNFESHLGRLKSYQILAVNRAEHQKAISVKLEIQQNTRAYLIRWIKSLWVPKTATEWNAQIISTAIDDSFKRLIEKSFLRRRRVQLTKSAEIQAIEIFTKNLRQLLLVAPVKNKTILSIDPGFKNGCKVAILDKNGKPLDTTVIFPFNPKQKDVAKGVLQNLVKKHRVDLIAIGNGTACRETECFVSEIIKNHELGDSNIFYSIVNEAGASIYSVSKEAKDEFGDLDPNLISAASIGRRLQDPLLELVKIEAKHIGVGMYQHDVNESLLKGALEGVIEDCVSFVGVDLNAASVDMLRRVAGVSKKQAEAIVEYRSSTGEFISRTELQDVKGIGKITYKNCAGFVRIIPKKTSVTENVKVEVKEENSGKKRKLKHTSSSEPSKKKRKTVGKKKDYVADFFDQTCIHPESYEIAHRLLQFLDASPEIIGSTDMKRKIEEKIKDFKFLADKLKSDKETLQLICSALQQTFDFDQRTEFEKPAFKTGITSINQLQNKQLVSGVVCNTTSFGVFVDIGLYSNGLIHSSKLQRNVMLGPGDRVECEVVNIEIDKNRVGLKLMKKLSKDIILR